VSLYGIEVQQASTTTFAAATGLAAAGSASVFSVGGLSAGSFIGSVGTTGLASVLSNSGTALVTFVSSAANLAITIVEATSTFASSASSTNSNWEKMNAIAQTVLTASTSASGTQFTAAPTAVTGALIAGGLAAVSAQTGTTQAVVLSSLALAALSSVTFTGFGPVPVFSYQGSAASNFTSALPTYFLAGIMSTGAVPANITLTSTNVTMSGSYAFQQPWFALIGS